jgi:hypothetical protein
VSLPASQQRILNKIETVLRDSDPWLASLFSIFGKLTKDEDMPRVEEVKARLAKLGAWIARRTAPVRQRIPQPSDRMKAIFFFPAALATVTCALLIGASGPAAQRCATSVRTPATELIVKARQCTLILVRTPVFAH